jgi:hypothetical protein
MPGLPDASRGRDGAGGTEGRDGVTLDAADDRLDDWSTADRSPTIHDASTDRSGPDGRGPDGAAPTSDGPSDSSPDARNPKADGALPDVKGVVDAHAVDIADTPPRDVTRDTTVTGDASDPPDGAGDAANTTDAADAIDGCGDCVPPAVHLLITEVVTRPLGAEFIEIMNPTPVPVALSDYLLSDSHLYYEVAVGTFPTGSGTDFAARFPEGSLLEPGGYAVVALGNASGGAQSFAATYGKAPDYELRPTANQATDDPTVPNMVSLGGASIGANASLTDGGEPVVLFSYLGGDLVADVDYVFYGVPSTSNPMVDKTGVIVGASTYLADTPASAQRATAAPGEAGSIHRCVYGESNETPAQGNGIAGHDETSEDVTLAFRLGTNAVERTPGGPPPAAMCVP